jgi:hypothetical protein
MVIPDVLDITTLADVRELMRHLPPDHRERLTWRHVLAGESTPPSDQLSLSR